MTSQTTATQLFPRRLFDEYKALARDFDHNAHALARAVGYGRADHIIADYLDTYKDTETRLVAVADALRRQNLAELNKLREAGESRA